MQFHRSTRQRKNRFCGKGKGGRRKQQGRDCKRADELGGGSAAAAGGDCSGAENVEGSTCEVRCYRCRKKCHWRADFREELCSQFRVRGHAADVYPLTLLGGALAVSNDDVSVEALTCKTKDDSKAGMICVQ